MAKAGDDLCCGTDYNSLVRAVKKGLISERKLTRRSGVCLRARFRLGFFDPASKVPFAQIPISENDTPEHAALALKAAQESIVLLKNSGVLPLDRTNINRIAVIGANADSVPMLLVKLQQHAVTSHHDSCKESRMPSAPAVAVDCEIQFVHWRCKRRGEIPSAESRTNAVKAALAADVVIYVGGISPRLEGEEMKVNYDGFSGGDRTQIELPAVQNDLPGRYWRPASSPLVFVNCSGSDRDAVGGEKICPRLLRKAWYPGEQGGRAVADILFGDENPAEADCQLLLSRDFRFARV